MNVSLILPQWVDHPRFNRIDLFGPVSYGQRLRLTPQSRSTPTRRLAAGGLSPRAPGGHDPEAGDGFCCEGHRRQVEMCLQRQSRRLRSLDLPGYLRGRSALHRSPGSRSASDGAGGSPRSRPVSASLMRRPERPTSPPGSSSEAHWARSAAASPRRRSSLLRIGQPGVAGHHLGHRPVGILLGLIHLAVERLLPSPTTRRLERGSDPPSPRPRRRAVRRAPPG